MAEYVEISREQIEKLCNIAIDDGKNFGFKLDDYSEKNADDLELFLGKVNEHIINKGLKDDVIWQLSVVYGIYLGELMLRCYAAEHGYKWIVKDGEPILKKENSFEMCPVTKVQKRLTGDESENVVSFFQIGKTIADGSFAKKVNRDKNSEE